MRKHRRYCLESLELDVDRVIAVQNGDDEDDEEEEEEEEGYWHDEDEDEEEEEEEPLWARVERFP